MSTNSIIGRKEDGQGRYCHWDGMPSHMGIDLITIVKLTRLKSCASK